MPDAAPPAAAPEAAVPVTPANTPTPATNTPVTPPSGDAKATGRGTRIFSLLAEEAAAEPGKPVEKKDPPAKAEATPADKTEVKTTPASEEKPIKATRKAPISKRPELPKETAPVAQPVAATPVSAKDDSDWESQLVDEEKQLLADAAEAEKFLPARKGLKEAAKKFVREHQKYLEKHQDIDSDPEEKAAYETWLAKNRPALSEAEQRTVSENRIADKVTKPWEDKYSEIEHELFKRDREPELRQYTERIKSDLNSTAIPAEIMEFAKQHGADVAKQQYSEELKVVNAIVNTAASDYEELIRLQTVNPKNGRPLSVPLIGQPGIAKDDPRLLQHERLEVMIKTVTDEFKNTASQKELVRDGKWFVTRDEWNSLPDSARGQYWTFNNQEIGQRALAWVPSAVDITIKQTREEMQNRGWERKKFTPPAAPLTPAVPPQPTRSAPGPNTSPVPPVSGSNGAAQTAGSRIASVLTAN